MAYIGAVAPGYDPTRASVPQLDAERFSGDATTTAFTLTRQVVSPTDIDVIVENVSQEPTVAYSVNGYTLTFTGAPGVGTNNIYVIYRGSGISNYAFVPDGSITYAKLANNIKQFTVDAVTANGTGTTVELTEAPASANSIIVSVDGVIQTAPTNYTLSGSTITFTGTPDNGANVVVRHIGFRTTSTVTALQASSVTATEIADGSVTNVKIVSVANTKITGLITASQIANVANTQLTGTLLVTQGGTGLTSIAHTVTVYTSGSGTYTTPANVKAIWVRAVGGGGGGGGSGNAGSPTNGGTGGTTTFGTSLLTANGGSGGPNSLTGGFGQSMTGGSASGGDVNITGGTPSAVAGNSVPAVYRAYGGSGGTSVLGGGGAPGSNGSGAFGNAGNAFGGGGSGIGGDSTTYASVGGAGGGYCEKLINSPSATYSYAVGAGGTAGAAGTGGSTAGAGGAGGIIITEYYV
jgi:hypothetical protein